MAKNEIKRFNETILGNPELQKELKTIGPDLEEIVRFANQKGFDFTMDDLKEIQSGDMQLSDEELESVAGGIVGAVLVQHLTVVGVVAVTN